MNHLKHLANEKKILWCKKNNTNKSAELHGYFYVCCSMCYHGNHHFTDERLSGFAPEMNFVSLL